MIQFDFLEISGSIADFQTRKKNANLSRFTLILPTYITFLPYFWGTPPGKKNVMNSPKGCRTDLLQLQPNDEQKRDGTSSQVVSALCFCMDLRPVKSHPNLGVNSLGEWVEFRQGSQRFVGWRDFFLFGGQQKRVSSKKKTERMVVTKTGSGGGWDVKCFWEDLTFGGVNKLYFLGWRGCWNFSKGLLLRSGEKFWAKMLGMPGREFFFGWPAESWLKNQRPGCGLFFAFYASSRLVISKWLFFF